MQSDSLSEHQKSTPISIGEYLHTSYQPDCEYIDGSVQERCVGERLHSHMIGHLLGLIYKERHAWNVDCLPTCRVQVSPTRIRVPDISVLRSNAPHERILRTPPLLIIEILSPEDTLSRLQQRVTDYVQFGTEHIWIIDPYTRRAYLADATGFHEPAEGSATATMTITGTAIAIILADLWRELDQQPA